MGTERTRRDERLATIHFSTARLLDFSTRLAVLPPADCLVRRQVATESKVLKVLKVLNFSGTGKSNIFACTFSFAVTSGVTEAPDPGSVGRSLLGDGDVLGLARRIHIEIVVGACHSGERHGAVITRWLSRW
ncbi:MAG: hypothetical protein K0S14_939 [Thermomicrobiales bacterium]|jgi:hypothetical protein|nr:hypothetical protein [Thermomicrobiales bacterium]MDF3015285.1 hypothetical protein [Thermomicrobiales bacterium]